MKWCISLIPLFRGQKQGDLKISTSYLDNCLVDHVGRSSAVPYKFQRSRKGLSWGFSFWLFSLAQADLRQSLWLLPRRCDCRFESLHLPAYDLHDGNLYYRKPSLGQNDLECLPGWAILWLFRFCMCDLWNPSSVVICIVSRFRSYEMFVPWLLLHRSCCMWLVLYEQILLLESLCLLGCFRWASLSPMPCALSLTVNTIAWLSWLLLWHLSLITSLCRSWRACLLPVADLVKASGLPCLTQ